MGKYRSSNGKERIMTTQRHTTTLRVPLRPITLDKSDLIDLCKLVEKAVPDSSRASMHEWIHFQIEGKSEVLTTDSVQSLENARLPRDLRTISLRAQSYPSNREIKIHIWDIDSAAVSFSEVEISGQDADWVSARAKELEDFIFDHKNFHWAFRNIGFVIFQAIALSTLLGYLLRDNTLGIPTALIVGYAYIFIIRKIFPIVVLDTGRPSTLKTIRKFLAFLIPAIFVGLLVTLISKLIPIG
jgi:hypothetical protein